MSPCTVRQGRTIEPTQTVVLFNSFHKRAVSLLVAAIVVGGTILQATAGETTQQAGGSSLTRRSWFKRMFFKPSWEQAAFECKTPRDVCRMVERHTKYRDEAVDRWSTADETWKTGTGDCEDFAISVQALCKELGIESSVQLYYSTSPIASGHAVAVGNWNGRQWFSSNGSYEEIPSPEAAAARVARILWCKPGSLWTILLADSDVERLIQGGSYSSVGSASVAVSASE